MLIHFCFAKTLDQQNIGPDLDCSCLTLMVFLEEFLKELIFEKESADDKNHKEIDQHVKN